MVPGTLYDSLKTPTTKNQKAKKTVKQKTDHMENHVAIIVTRE